MVPCVLLCYYYDDLKTSEMIRHYVKNRTPRNTTPLSSMWPSRKQDGVVDIEAAGTIEHPSEVSTIDDTSDDSKGFAVDYGLSQDFD